MQQACARDSRFTRGCFAVTNIGLIDNAYLSLQKQTQLLITTVHQYVDQNMSRLYELYQQCIKKYLVGNMQSVGTQIVIFYILFITLRLYPSNWLLHSERHLLKM